MAVADTPMCSVIGNFEWIIRGRVQWRDGRAARKGWWLRFDTPENVDDWHADMVPLVDWRASRRTTERGVGCHPTEGSPPSGTHYVSFYCDDIETTVAEMRERGVEFPDEVADQGYALAIHFEMPGGVQVELYEPRYK